MELPLSTYRTESTQAGLAARSAGVNSYSPKEVGYYVPEPEKGKNSKSNDVFRSDNGLLYLLTATMAEILRARYDKE
jgi:hypothetical protein